MHACFILPQSQKGLYMALAHLKWRAQHEKSEKNYMYMVIIIIIVVIVLNL